VKIGPVDTEIALLMVKKIKKKKKKLTQAKYIALLFVDDELMMVQHITGYSLTRLLPL